MEQTVSTCPVWCHGKHLPGWRAHSRDVREIVNEFSGPHYQHADADKHADSRHPSHLPHPSCGTAGAAPCWCCPRPANGRQGGRGHGSMIRPSFLHLHALIRSTWPHFLRPFPSFFRDEAATGSDTPQSDGESVPTSKRWRGTTGTPGMSAAGYGQWEGCVPWARVCLGPCRRSVAGELPAP